MILEQQWLLQLILSFLSPRALYFLKRVNKSLNANDHLSIALTKSKCLDLRYTHFEDDDWVNQEIQISKVLHITLTNEKRMCPFVLDEKTLFDQITIKTSCVPDPSFLSLPTKTMTIVKACATVTPRRIQCSFLFHQLRYLILDNAGTLVVSDDDAPLPNLCSLKASGIIQYGRLEFPQCIKYLFPALQTLCVQKIFAKIEQPYEFPTQLHTLHIRSLGFPGVYLDASCLPRSLRNLAIPHVSFLIGKFPLSIQHFAVIDNQADRPVNLLLSYLTCLSLTNVKTLELKNSHALVSTEEKEWWKPFKHTVKQGCIRHLCMDQFIPVKSIYCHLTAISLPQNEWQDGFPLPKQLVFLDLLNMSSLKKHVLPQSLRHLFLRRYNGPLRKGVLPSGLITLSLPYFDKKLAKDFCFPKTLVYLDLKTFSLPQSDSVVFDEKPTITFDSFTKMDNFLFS